MYTVTQRANSFAQPYGGFLPPTSFEPKTYNDGSALYAENVHGRFIGLAVDYLTRYKLTGKARASFEIPLRGALILRDRYRDMETYRKANKLFEEARHGNTLSAIRLTAFDDVYRTESDKVEDLNPDAKTAANVNLMVERSVSFLEHCGHHKIYSGLDFEGAYTETVINGDCDYVTDNALIDFKVLRGEITSKHTLQILMYYLMGLRSHNKDKFKNVKWLAFYNPRKNKVYYRNVASISSEVLEHVSNEVIGYGRASSSYGPSASPTVMSHKEMIAIMTGWNRW